MRFCGSSSLGGQTDEGAVNPTGGIKVLLRLHLEGGQPRHGHRSRLLVKAPHQLLLVITYCPPASSASSSSQCPIQTEPMHSHCSRLLIKAPHQQLLVITRRSPA